VQERAEADTFEDDPALGPGAHSRGSYFRLAAAEALAHATEEEPDRPCAFMLNYQVLTETWDRRSVKLIHPDLDKPKRRLIREVFGNRFHSLDVAQAWLSPGVVSLARRLYDDRGFDRMPLLAEALEGAGCVRADTLLHCRSPLAHVRGCWVLDALLGKLRGASRMPAAFSGTAPRGRKRGPKSQAGGSGVCVRCPLRSWPASAHTSPRLQLS
jgi:hypothetical protein